MNSLVSRRPRGLSILVLALLTLLAAALRLADAGHSLWLDELHTSWVVAGTWSDIPDRAAIGNYPPLYFWLLWPLVQVFGQSEIVLRGLSLAAGVALVPVGWWAARRLTGCDGAARFAALLFAIDRISGIWFSQEARPYALVMLLAVVQLVLFHAAATTGDRWRRVGFIVVAAAMFYLHYTSLLFLTGQLAWFAGRWIVGADEESSPSAYRARDLLLDLVILALFCLPAAPHLLEIAARREQWAQFIEQRPFQEVFTLFPIAAYLAGPALAALLVCRLIAPGGRDDARSEPGSTLASPPRSAGALLVCSLFVPLSVAWAATWYDQARLLFPRYLLPSFICLPLLSAWLLTTFRAAGRAAFGLTALLCVQFSSGPLQSYLEFGDVSGHFSEDWRAAVELVNQSAGDAAPIFVDAGLIEGELLRGGPPDEALRQYLLFPVLGIYALERPEQAIPLPPWQPPTADPFGLGPYLDLLRTQREMWFVIRARVPAEFVADELLVWLTRQRIDARIAGVESLRGLAVVKIAAGP